MPKLIVHQLKLCPEVLQRFEYHFDRVILHPYIPHKLIDFFFFLLHVLPHVNLSKTINKEQQYLLADAQTSGGLLISVAKNKAEELQNTLSENGCLTNSIIGNIYNPAEFPIYVD